MEVRYAYQELDKIPAGCVVPAQRTKPWGTSHAVLCAKAVIGDAPFAVINADDYYGKEAYREIYQFLSQGSGDFCMVGYRLGNTVTENGTVARGVCQVDAEGFLTSVVERTKIATYEGGIHFTEDDGATWEDLQEDTLVSMNMWGFTPAFLEAVEADFPRFFREDVQKNPAKAEMFLPSTVGMLLQKGAARVKMLQTRDKWFGVTYAQDKPVVVAALQEMTEKGMYPQGLWK